MPRRRFGVLALSLWLASLAAPAAALPSGREDAAVSQDADHIGGSFVACGRVTAFTVPLPGLPGSLTVAGVVDRADHVFPIAEVATVDPRVAPLAAAGEWTCLDLVGDGMGVLASVSVASSVASCGVIEEGGGRFSQLESSAQEFTTLVLDGDAAAIISADPNLLVLLGAIARATHPTAPPTEACLDISLAADGTLNAIALDYDLGEDDFMASIACGLVDGTPIAYRDAASQPYPEAGVISVDGFEVDASVVEAGYQAVLAFHLDAGLPLCLLVRVVDSTIVKAGVITTVADPQVCGRLEVRGGRIFINRVAVSEALTALVEPESAFFEPACVDAGAQENVAISQLLMCGILQSVGERTVTISGITLQFGTVIDRTDAPPLGGPQTIRIGGPNAFLRESDSIRFNFGAIDGCPALAMLPNAAMPASDASAAP